MRTETDLLGNMMIPDDAYYGIQTERARINFAVSGKTAVDVPNYLWSIAAIKRAAAEANSKIGALDPTIAKAIIQAATEVMEHKFDDQFPIDIFQGGGGTSTNMNMNEVIANRANEILTGSKGYDVVHPNTHVNMCQSTNDVIPAAMKITCCLNLVDLISTVSRLEEILEQKTKQFAQVVKLGRTCLQDAVPMTLGQQFSGYYHQIKRLHQSLTEARKQTFALPLGATAIGTGLSTQQGYLEHVYPLLQQITGEPFVAEENFFDGLQNGDSYLEVAAQIKKLAVFLSKMSTDFRLQGSGPRAGFNELLIPAVQPGSSIMPGKINPVIPELINQITYQVIGNDLSITMAVEGGELDLNVWEPVIIKALFESCGLLTNAIPILIDKCLLELQPNIEVCRRYAEQSTALATVISTLFGYKVGSRVAIQAFEQNLSVREVVIAEKILTESQADYLLDPMTMCDPAASAAAIHRYHQENS
ncbi:aspartate ammonia-lyase [Budviciaceae bacterium CWB-B4]|uniref:Aspartate ammonia-lyase n=1 Tax=Limnobaculum xujianqingii TaxID=2738837 RepID=A0A9D7FX57_9GAMM|nr:aspartate ammonia-lyase [Limnobaculum xujianqingii]MBK5072721.1 aspartate ammonia-lyase [Limnobaculum xujianqingii]MBK5176030.1 aspartate ammonia-lyase [Limnobaculum xujianqingii]